MIATIKPGQPCQLGLEVGWYETVWHTSTSLVGSKPYRHFSFWETPYRYVTGQYGSRM